MYDIKRIQIQYLSINMIRDSYNQNLSIEDNENKKTTMFCLIALIMPLKYEIGCNFEVQTSLSTPLKFDIVLASIILTSS